MEEILIAPCGANCNVCMSYLAMKNNVKSKGINTRYCGGCGYSRGKGCGWKKLGCELLINRRVRYCFECENFPCDILKKGNERYREKYLSSPLDNLYYIKEHGIEKFLQKEEERWKCPNCGGVISYHNGICYTCELDKLKKKIKHNPQEKMEASLIAPCGMNCAICSSYLRDNNPCPGCHDRDTKCTIKNCDIIKTNKSGLCYECEAYPCKRLQQLDERYRMNNHMSMIENLECIRDNGIDKLLELEEKKWRCPECGRLISSREGFCLNCTLEKRKTRNKDKKPEITEETLIAPCGMNCAVCGAYLAKKYDLRSQGLRIPYCDGCRPRDKLCSFIKKQCEPLLSGELEYCYECDKFPCNNLVRLDKRYRERFNMSMIENLNYIKENGMGNFLEKEKKKWKCQECGGVISCHNGICFNCGVEKMKSKEIVL
jgi:hypothetical protein